MKTIDDLPAEMLCHIFDFLDQKTVARCLAVNKLWQEHANKYMFLHLRRRKRKLSEIAFESGKNMMTKKAKIYSNLSMFLKLSNIENNMYEVFFQSPEWKEHTKDINALKFTNGQMKSFKSKFSIG